MPARRTARRPAPGPTHGRRVGAWQLAAVCAALLAAGCASSPSAPDDAHHASPDATADAAPRDAPSSPPLDVAPAPDAIADDAPAPDDVPAAPPLDAPALDAPAPDALAPDAVADASLDTPAESSLDGDTASVASCTVPTVDVLYPGALPPNPYAPQPAADRCVARAHDAIIVLGCPSNADGTASTCQTRRADIAVAAMRAGLGDRFITSGAAVHNAFVEADALRDLLLARGVAADHIWEDRRAEHTDENIYYSTQIMAAQGWTTALVISEDPGQLIMTAVCDADCCVQLGRLTVLAFATGAGTFSLGHYVRYPPAVPVSDAECRFLEQPLKFMCTNLASRRACAGRITLPPSDGG